MNKILNNNPIVLLGDIHGDWDVIGSFCCKFPNLNIIQVGDFGVGFTFNKNKEERKFKNLSEHLKRNDNELFVIRGNHDDPSYFNDRVIEDCITFLSDYSVLTQNDKTILCVGGGISIDRTLRKKGSSWWEDEGVVFNLDKLIHADILLTHVAPQQFPISKEETNPMVLEFAKNDPPLISELKKEKFIVGEISDLSNAKRHYFGHYHFALTHDTPNRKYRCLNINEFLELKFE